MSFTGDPNAVPLPSDTPPLPNGAGECGQCSCEQNTTPPTPSQYGDSPGTEGDSCCGGGPSVGATPGTVAQTVLSQVGVSLPQFGIPGGCCGSPLMAYMKSDGTLVTQWRPPATGGLSGPDIALTYNSSGSQTSPYGRGWYLSLDRRIQNSPSGTVTVITGSGESLVYLSAGTLPYSPYYTPPDGALNSLRDGTPTSAWIETQPNGFEVHYATISYDTNRGHVSRLVSPAGAAWTVLRDGSGRIEMIQDPFDQYTTFGYTGDYLSQIKDRAGRITDIAVSGGNLTGITSPETCQTSLFYDANDLLSAWRTPALVVTSFTFDGSRRLQRVESPSGSHSISYGTIGSNNYLEILNPRGYASTYILDGDLLQAYVNPLGDLTTYA